ncbi:hypothetical protein NN561_010541 [Cricetulus griseus]
MWDALKEEKVVELQLLFETGAWSQIQKQRPPCRGLLPPARCSLKCLQRSPLICGTPRKQISRLATPGYFSISLAYMLHWLCTPIHDVALEGTSEQRALTIAAQRS